MVYINPSPIKKTKYVVRWIDKHGKYGNYTYRSKDAANLRKETEEQNGATAVTIEQAD